MIDVVLDTNVLVASLFKAEGPNRQVLRTILAKLDCFRICYSSQIMAEYEDVLSRPAITARGISEEASALISLIRQIGSEIVPKTVSAVVYPDEKDKPFLEAAVYSEGVLFTIYPAVQPEIDNLQMRLGGIYGNYYVTDEEGERVLVFAIEG